jgi:hypothetical protein
MWRRQPGFIGAWTKPRPSETGRRAAATDGSRSEAAAFALATLARVPGLGQEATKPRIVEGCLQLLLVDDNAVGLVRKGHVEGVGCVSHVDHHHLQ